MSMIHEIFLAVKGGADLENVIPTGADLTLWRRMLDSYNPAAKPKRKATRATSTGRSPSTGSGRSKRSRKAAMDSAVGLATLTLVERVNGKTLNAWGRATEQEIPFDGRPVPYESDADDYAIEAAI